VPHQANPRSGALSASLEETSDLVGHFPGFLFIRLNLGRLLTPRILLSVLRHVRPFWTTASHRLSASPTTRSTMLAIIAQPVS
jgi:hypothetical protein